MAVNIAEIGFAADTSALRTAKTDIQAIVAPAVAAESAARELSGQMTALQAAATGAATAASKVAAAATGQAASVAQAAAAQTQLTAVTHAAVAPVQTMQLHTANLAAQFQDIGVTAAAGMNPLMIALQQGTQISAALASSGANAGSALSQLGAAAKTVVSPLALMTIGIVAAVAALIQLVPWSKVAATSLRAMATGVEYSKTALQNVAPYVAAFGAALLLWNIPLILSGLVALTVGVYGFAKAMVIAAATNPFIAIPLAIGLAIGAIIAFRKDIAKFLGENLIAEIKKPFNVIIGIGVATVSAIIAAFRVLPGAMVSIFDTVTGNLRNWGNELLKIASMIVTKLPNFMGGNAAGIEFRFDEFVPKDGVSGVTKIYNDIGVAIKSAFDTDYIGGAASAVGKGVDYVAAKFRKWANDLDGVNAKLQKLIENTKAQVASAKLEQDSIGMSTERAAVLKAQMDLLNKAREDGIKLSTKDAATLLAWGETLGKVTSDTEKLREAFDLSKDVVRGFVTDLRDGLKQGETFMKSFLDAVTNILTKVSDKLINLSIDLLFQSEKGGASGGFLGSLVKFFGPLAGTNGGGTSPSVSTGGSTAMMAKGGAFTNGIYKSPTMFNFANGSQFGQMGEAGPEAVMPLKRGPDGSLGVALNAANNNGSGPSVVVIVENNAAGTSVREEASTGPDGREMRRIIIDTVQQATASGELDASMRSRYGNSPTKITRG